MRPKQEENNTFPQRLGEAAKEIGSFSVGLPLGFVIGIIPGIGFLFGGLAINGHLEQNIRYRDEHWQDYEKRLADNKKQESLSWGTSAGIVIGWIGQVVIFAG